MARLIGILVIALLAGCGAQYVDSAPSASIAEVAPKLRGVSGQEEGPLIYLYRPWHFGDAIDYRVNTDLDPDDDGYVVRVPSIYYVDINASDRVWVHNGNYFVHETKPGAVVVEAVNLPSSSVVFTAEPGAVYFIRVSPAFQAGPYVRMATVAEALGELLTLDERPPWAILVPG